MSFHVKQTSRIPFYTHCRLYYGFWLVLHPLGVGVRHGSFWLEFCHSPLYLPTRNVVFLMFLHGSTLPVQRLVNPSDRPIGDPDMVHLPQDIQKCFICQNSVTWYIVAHMLQR